MMNERRIRSNKIRRQREIRKNILLLVLSVCLVVSLSITIGSFISSAKSSDDNLQHKFYKSIMVRPGDTLSSIAAVHSGYTDVDHYVTEVKQMNSLKDDTIKAGCYLVIPYYDDVSNYPLTIA